MLRRNRLYRLFRVSFTIWLAAMRYLWLMLRAKLPWVKPSEASWNRAHARTGRAVYRLATRLNGAFVKLGQVLGSRADFFPEAFVGQLRDLHDSVPARPFAKLRKHVERQLGRPISEVFAQISEQPLAAASLAQVHEATLTTGERVVIKVQYPEARKLFPGDLASLRRAVRVVRWLNRSLDLRALADELAEFVVLELEFDREAASTERVRKAFEGNPRVRVPRVHRELSSNGLLVLEYIDGERLTDLERLRELGVDLRAVAESVAGIYVTMIFEHGFFHGDPHPGNLLLCANDAVALLDFGLAKELPEGFADGVAEMIVNAVSGQGERALAAARAIGFQFKTDDPSQLLELMKMLMGDYSSNQRLVEVLKASALESVPSHFALIVRAMVLLNGLSHLLVPKQRIISGTLARTLMPRVMARAQKQQAG